MRGKSMILIVIALGCGLVASIGISKILDRQSDGKPTEVATKKVYVTVSDLDLGEVIDSEMVKLEEWPADRVPEGAVTKLEEVVDLAPNQRLYAGEVIRKEKLVDPAKAAGRAFLIPKGYRVQAVKVNSDSAVGNIITPGDHVDVQLYLRKSSSIPQATTKTILEDVRVFAVNAETEKQIDAEGQKINAKTVSLLVKPQQSHTLLLASRLGQISLSLRHPDDDSQSLAHGGASIDELLNISGDIDATPTNDKDQPLAATPPNTSTDADAVSAARNDFTKWLDNLAPAEQPEAPAAKPEQLAATEFRMQLLTPEGITTFSLIDDEEFSAAEVLTEENILTAPGPAAGGSANTPPASKPTGGTPAQVNDPDYTPADDMDNAGGDDSNADSDDDA